MASVWGIWSCRRDSGVGGGLWPCPEEWGTAPSQGEAGVAPRPGDEGIWSCFWEIWDEEWAHVLESRGGGWGVAQGTLPSIPLTLPCSGQQDSDTTAAGWSTTGRLALWNSQHLPRCPSYRLIPWRCGSEMAAKSATCWAWRWGGWRAAVLGMWCSQVLAGLQARLSAVLRLSNGGYQACTSLPSCASCRPRTAGCQPHPTQA